MHMEQQRNKTRKKNNRKLKQMTSTLRYGADSTWEQNEFLVYNTMAIRVVILIGRFVDNYFETEFTRKYFSFIQSYNSRFEITSTVTNMSDGSNENDCVLSAADARHSDCKREMHF